MFPLVFIAVLSAGFLLFRYGLKAEWRLPLTFGLIGVLVLLTVGSLILGGIKQQNTVKRVMREGAPGMATVVEIHGTGVRVNKVPQVRLVLRIDLENSKRYQITRDYVLPFAGYSLLPGHRLRVFADNDDQENVVIDWNSSQSDAETRKEPASDRLRQLDSLRDQGLITEDEYRTQRQRLLSEL